MLRKLCGVRSMAALGTSLFATVAAGQVVAPPPDVLFVSKAAGECAPGGVFNLAVADPGSAAPEASETSAAPYSGVGTTTVTRILADGNRIVRTNTMRYARDGQGRVRTEYSLAALGPFALEETHMLATIDDPVAGRHYVLHPDKMRADVFETKGIDPGERGLVIRHEAIDAEGPVAITEGSAGVAVAQGVAGAGPAGQGFFVMAAPAGTPLPIPPDCGPANMQAKKLPPPVSLGERTIEGLKVLGSRHEFEIAAGMVGNEQPITMRTEQWFSPELGVVIESTHHDPLAGDTTYKLTQIKRGEPDAALFRVPAGYKIEQMPKGEFLMREAPPSRLPDRD